jgi:hypothetical protein
MSHEGRRGSSSTHQGRGSAEWKSNGIAGSGSASGQYASSGFSQSGGVEERVADCFEETGQEAIVKVKQPDPFLRTDPTLISWCVLMAVRSVTPGIPAKRPTRGRSRW